MLTFCLIVNEKCSVHEIKKLGGIGKMDAIISNIGYSLLASIIYDISKVCLGKFYYKKKNEYSIKKIEKMIQEKLGDKFEELYMSGEFNSFLKAPFFKDTIENYIIYKITGKCDENIRRMKKNNNNIIMERDVIAFLSNKLFENYYSGVINKPSKTIVRQFFEQYFNMATEYIILLMQDEDKMDVLFINGRIDFAQENILLRLNETVETIKRMIKCDIIQTKDIYENNVKEYHSILKTNHSKAHVYLLDTFDFDKFYVPPFLRQFSSERVVRDPIRLMGQDYLIDIQNRTQIKNSDYFDDWKYIFESTGIVYVTGGAGYGKSLFLKKLINDFEEMNILNSSEYLVIYGDLKSFYVEGEQPLSVVKFLQASMVKETLMDEKNFPIDMIEYYLRMGRCLILLDALDEVEKQKREELHKRIIAFFKNQNPNNRICITSRNRGFIPEKEVEVFDILPLDRLQIESYVDNIIKLGRFDGKDKETFLEQSSVLVDKGFLNSFLVLSLLINIYKAERELPENKMELYQKCFDYIAYRREKEKTKAKFDWERISCMMKDNTFMELAKMCFPNNSDIGKDEIVEMLCRTYSRKYTSIAETECAAEQFLAFCSDRTELFVPAAGEDRFKFFHRSFFEYFYAQYVFLRVREVEEVYNLLQQFDVDSEVFELTLAMMKQKDEPRYQELMEYIFQKSNDEIKEKNAKLNAFNVLTLGMQVVDDNIYISRYVDYVVNNYESIIKNIEHIPNQGIIYNVIASNESFIQKVIGAYGFNAKFHIIAKFLKHVFDVEQIAETKEFQKTADTKIKHYFNRRFYYGLNNVFYLKLYIKNVDCGNIINDLSENDLEALMANCRINKRAREKHLRDYIKYKALDEEKQKTLQKLILCSPA